MADTQYNPFANIPSFSSMAQAMAGFPSPMAARDYVADAWQRAVLFLDILRERGNAQKAITSRPNATVLSFDHEILLSGAALPRPINYSLARILPRAGQHTDPAKRPLIVVDPRAGQGPGIGGFNAVSEIGDALEAGHPVYFIFFTKDPMPGQTFIDVVEGQVKFVEHIVSLHPDAPRPFAFGNCQAGYQTLMVATLKPELFGPVIVAGSPMSYWQGEHGKNPMRYSGGLLGGSWITALTSDLGGGRFDGTWLILNFDALSPSNWLWSKQYDVLSRVDTAGPRYLGFEKWWGDFITLNGEEIQWIVDELFIGDRLTRNELRASDGTVFDLREVTSPIVVLTSEGDNISPPAQTLGWILDLYKDVAELRARGRTIVYTVNPHAGHLAIFVSPKIGGKEDEEFVRLIEEIDLLPPGLYELLIEPAGEAEVAAGGPRWNSRFEMRTFDHIRAFGRNSVADDRAFETVRRLSEHNLALYETFLRPAVRALATPMTANALFDYNPLRMSYTMFADDNPLMRPVAALADQIRANRAAAGPDNAFLKMQDQLSEGVVKALDGLRDARDLAIEHLFFHIFTAPALQAALGLAPDEVVRHRPGVTAQERQHLVHEGERLALKVTHGGHDEALVRAVLAVLTADRGIADGALIALKALKAEMEIHSEEGEFRRLIREQAYILTVKRQEAVDALTQLVPDPADYAALVETARRVAGAGGALTDAQAHRLEMLGGGAPKAARPRLAKTAA